MKNEAKKSLVPYLKFEQLFLFMHYETYDLNHELVATSLNGVLMTVPNSIKYKLIMEKFYQP